MNGRMSKNSFSTYVWSKLDSCFCEAVYIHSKTTENSTLAVIRISTPPTGNVRFTRLFANSVRSNKTLQGNRHIQEVTNSKLRNKFVC